MAILSGIFKAIPVARLLGMSVKKGVAKGFIKEVPNKAGSFTLTAKGKARIKVDPEITKRKPFGFDKRANQGKLPTEADERFLTKQPPAVRVEPRGSKALKKILRGSAGCP